MTDKRKSTPKLRKRDSQALKDFNDSVRFGIRLDETIRLHSEKEDDKDSSNTIHTRPSSVSLSRSSTVSHGYYQPLSRPASRTPSAASSNVNYANFKELVEKEAKKHASVDSQEILEETITGATESTTTQRSYGSIDSEDILTEKENVLSQSDKNVKLRRVKSTASSKNSRKSVGNEKKKVKPLKLLTFGFKSFSSFNALIPFEVTSISHLPFHVDILREGMPKLPVQVQENTSVDELKKKVSKKTKINIKQIVLSVKETLLEGGRPLSSYRINSKSQINMKIVRKISINIKYHSETYTTEIYPTETISFVKTKLSETLGKDLNECELVTDKDELMEEKAVYFYNLNEMSDITLLSPTSQTDHILFTTYELEKSSDQPDSAFNTTTNHPTSAEFQNLTKKLGKCSCKEDRIELISQMLETATGNNKHLQIEKIAKCLSAYTQNFHHKSCSLSDDKTPIVSEDSFFPNGRCETPETSSVSLEDYVHGELDRVERNNCKIEIDSVDIDYLVSVENFRSFKRYIRPKIGTHCNMRSVACLYQYARILVRHVGINNSSKLPIVRRILTFTNMYFKKYFEQSIIDGGLDALTQTVSDID